VALGEVVSGIHILRATMTADHSSILTGPDQRRLATTTGNRRGRDPGETRGGSGESDTWFRVVVPHNGDTSLYHQKRRHRDDAIKARVLKQLGFCSEGLDGDAY
jgi:hypothetical protein